MKDKKYHILIVDDERDICRALEFLLTRENYKVSTAYSGEEALKKFKEQRFDLVLTDLKMEGLTGIDVLEKVKETDPSTIVIIMTAYASVESAVEAMKKGAAD